MIQFKVGKTYRINGGGEITVTKRTAKFLVFTGDFEGRKMIEPNNYFGLGENIWIGSGNLKRPCFAAHVN